MNVFLDASALIYLIEGQKPLQTRTRAALRMLTARYADLRTAISRLTWLECRVRPARLHQARTLALYDRFFEHPDLAWVELDRNVVELATAIRIRHGLKTPDALQAASCLQFRDQHVFLSGDRGFARVQGLNLLRI